MTLRSIAAEQSKATELTMDAVLDYCTMHPNGKIRYKKSDLLLNIPLALVYTKLTAALQDSSSFDLYPKTRIC